MKKILISLVMTVLLAVTAIAQIIPYPPSTDTLPCGTRQPNYWYGDWYDTTHWFLSPLPDEYVNVYFSCASSSYHYSAHTIRQYTPHPLRIRGLWAMVAQEADFETGPHPIRDSTRLPEYLFLYLRDPKYATPDDDSMHFLTRIATARWDTVSPKMLCLTQTADGLHPKLYCHVYEALFDTVYTLDGEFWIGGSAYSNTFVSYPPDYGWQHFPSRYLTINTTAYTNWLNDPQVYCFAHGPDGPFYHYSYDWYYGPYGVITDGQRYVEVASSDTSQGLGLYTAYYTDSTFQNIAARAKSCYRFSHWNDSVTDNPRTIYVTSDTSFTAYFEPAPIHDVMVRSGDEVMGQATRLVRRIVKPGELIPGDQDPEYIRVEGDSAYCAGDEAIFKAFAREGYVFCRWSNGSSDNPLAITVSSDTLLTAYFAPEGLHLVKALSNNDEAGHVSGVGRYPNCDTAWLTAVVDDTAYLFRHWSGGITENPLAVVSATDTLLTAYFTTRVLYRVDAQSGDETMGHVEGSGVYYEGDEAVIEAVAHQGNHFERWNDSVRENPRRIVVVQDTAFTAVFGVEPVGVREVAVAGVKFGLVPNPAADEVRCVTEGEGFGGGVLTVVDASGREVLRKELPRQTQAYTFRVADYPAGTYFVTLTTAKGTSTQKLVVEGK